MLTRRHLLRSAGGLAMAPMFFNALMAEESNTAASDTIVVTIYLQGGNDGLNTVIPLTQFKAYTALRTPAAPPPGLALAYTEAQLEPTVFDTTPAGTNSTFAFAPGMTAMRSLYGAGNLAVLAGIALPLAEQNALSHYNATEDWMTGQINITGNAYGWLGQGLAGATVGSLGAVASLNGTAQILSVPNNAGLVLSTPIQNFGPSYGTTDNSKALIGTYHQLVQYAPANSTYAFQQNVAEAALAAVDTVQSIAKKVSGNDYPTPVAWLDYQLQDVARLIIGGAGIRGYFVEHSGFDTHSEQALYQPTLLQQLGNSMSNFHGYLQKKGVSSNVLIITISDFGRRPQANLNFGTDHGGGTVGFALGDMVKGGVYGNYPSLKQFDPNGNLKLEIDFRNMLSDVITYMGGNPTPILAPYVAPGVIGFLP
jgi:uncharacterized protein (DUF1501 family)